MLIKLVYVLWLVFLNIFLNIFIFLNILENDINLCLVMNLDLLFLVFFVVFVRILLFLFNDFNIFIMLLVILLKIWGNCLVFWLFWFVFEIIYLVIDLRN